MRTDPTREIRYRLRDSAREFRTAWMCLGSDAKKADLMAPSHELMTAVEDAIMALSMIHSDGEV